MLRVLIYACAAVGSLGLTSVAGAQEVIHAMTGTIRSIAAAQKTFTLFRDNGSLITFNDVTSGKPGVAYDKDILPDATAAQSFDETGAYAIVFYYGLIDHPTAVAVQALGHGPFTATVGTITSFNEKGRQIAIKDDSGSVHSFKLNASTIAESDLGVVEGLKLRAEKGEHIRVVGEVTDGSPTALFLRVM